MAEDGQGRLEEQCRYLEACRASLAQIQSTIDEHAEVSSRHREDIQIVAVTKYLETWQAELLHQLGLRDFAENRWQVAREKLSMKDAHAVRWHFIGPIQSNKAKYVARAFDVVHSLDNVSLLRLLEREATLADRTLDVLVQVNLDGGANRHGVSVSALSELLKEVVKSSRLHLVGLMTMAPATEDTRQIRDVFAQLRELRDEYQQKLSYQDLVHLSMGMSHDFPIAVEEGATMLRLGRGLVLPATYRSEVPSSVQQRSEEL
ncbi:MAG: YggS family pyridoxal phosphate-dependent enzyme [Alicyclobacillaceae bacterium]|nr:YggS family pyridoxal phosphate-dependent enzyme [Alicyclobacillaceae bacterium]